MANPQANIANFFTPLKGPGRSAATLIEDLILFDPRQDIQPGYHLLEDGARSFGQAQQVGHLLPEDSCIHDYRLKKRQSAPPAVDARPDASSIWHVAAICQKCRIHILLTVDYTAAWQDEPCPTWVNPLHYLVRSTWRQDAAYRDLQRDGIPTSDEVHVYECSSKKCSAVVTVHMSPPVLPPDAIHLLVDKDLLAKRTNAAFEAKAGHTEGMKRPSPLDVLADLRAYFRNSWTRSSASEISLDNKRFVVRFGPEGTACRKVLELLGFQLKTGTSWVVPQPMANDPIPLQEPLNIFLDNIEAELDILIESRPEEERIASQDTTKLESALLQMSRVLSSRNYDTDPAFRTTQKSLWHRPRPFTVLGIPQDASDDLIIWAYQRQIMLEHNLPAQTAKLMTALEDIQRHRQSEKLTQQVAIERSMGRYGEQTIADAYRSLGLPANGGVDDATIIGNFESRLFDAPNQEQQMRESMVAIGEFRKSQRIIDYARNTLSSYDDAAKFLGIHDSTDDSFVVSIYHSKISDNAANLEMAQKAMHLIAEHRNSDALRSFVASGCHGDLEPPKMDISEAYSCLSLDDRTIEDEAVWAVFELAMEDGYQSRDKLQQAVVLIAEDRDSSYLRGRLNISNGPQQPPTNLTLTEPVGLDNIGNTCYLNSLLQSLFTITTVRDIVLNFDEYKQDLTAESARDKHVGQRAITIREIRSAQNFVSRLAELFRQMITAPARAVRPTQELARLTLETEQAKRRNSTIKSDRRPTLGTINDLAVHGPVPEHPSSTGTLPTVQSPSAIEDLDPMDEEVSQAETHEAQTLEHTPDVSDADDDDASEKTLVSQTQSGDGSTSPSKGDEHMEDRKTPLNDVPLPSTRVISPGPTEEEASTLPLTIAVDSTPSMQSTSRTVSPEPKQQPQTDSSSPPKYNPPPGPPPVPPRPVPTGTLEEYAKQQDVAEVLAHAIIQLSSAIRPVGVDERQEQQDEVRETFYGEERKLVLRGPASPPPPVPFLFISFPIHNEPRDLYGAFDNYFDPEEIGSSEIFATITKLPPVLCFALTRVIQKVDKEAKLSTNIKLNNHVEIPTTLFMDRYMDAPPGSALLQRKQQTWQYKKELRKLKSRISQLEPQNAAPVDEQLNLALATMQHLAEVGATEKIDGLMMDAESLHKMSGLVQNVRNEREIIRNRISVLEQKINDSFTDADFRKQEYKLHALFFHRGTAAAGHYWIYIFDHVNETWRKYNDETVSQVNNLKEIFSDPRNDRSNPSWSSYSPANPYFLMYVKASKLSSTDDAATVVETVIRNPVIPPLPPPPTDSHDVAESAIIDEGIDIRPLGADTPKNYEIHASHHEFAGQPSQMSYLPPDGPRLQGQEPHTQQESEFASIGSVMQQNRPSTQHVRQISWDEQQLEQAIQQSLQPSNQKEGGWDNSENRTVPREAW